MTLPDRPWAKRSDDGAWLSVTQHCLDVATAAHTVLGHAVLRHRLASAFGAPLTPAHTARLAVLAGLHDAGKLLAGFQGGILPSPPLVERSHTATMLAALGSRRRDVAAALRLDMLSHWLPAAPALYAVICHHGEPIAPARWRPLLATLSAQLATTALGHHPAEEMAKLTEALLTAFPEALQDAPVLPLPAAASHLLAGLVMAADWMGSFAERFPYRARRLDETRAAAKALVTGIGWSGWHSGAAAEAVLGGQTPRGAQAAILATPLTERLVVIEAPTGSGKTEAALMHASRLVAAGLVDGLYFAVPSRSAATELHARIARRLVAAHPLLAGRVVRAVPGMLAADDARDVHDEHGPSWAIGAPKRALAAPVAVGTIDQALLSILAVRHAWMRALFLSRNLLVIDEVHASDAYMAGLTEALVRRQLDLGGHVLAMSATLGETLLARLQGRPRRKLAEAVAVPYPAIRTSTVTPCGPAPRRQVTLEIADADEALTRIASAVADGRCVLAIRSTVTDAVAMEAALAARGVPTMLHHSRYALHDRTLLDTRLMGLLGPGGTRTPIAVIATQTAEQSLDIDADLLVTDACPADVLLQRLGRLHRHRTGTLPTAVMIDPGPLDRYLAADGRVRGRGGQGWAWVYGNLLAVNETIAAVRASGSVTVPDDCRTLVERSTHADHLRDTASALGPAWLALWRRLYMDQGRQEALAAGNIVDWSQPYDRATVVDDAVTRLGDGTVDVTVTGLRSPFDGTPIDTLPVPVRWLRDVTPGTSASADGSELRLGAMRLRYDARGLQRQAQASS